MEIRLLSDHRKDLVAERTRVQNRLRWHLLELCPELERSLKRGALEQPRQLDRIDRRLRRMPACARVRVAREQIRQIRVLTRQADALERELLARVKAHRPQLLAETGCGGLTAARQSGTAPIPVPRANATATGSTAAATANSTTRCTSSRSPAPATTRPPRPTSRARKPRARPRRERCAASNATSRGASTISSHYQPRRQSRTAARPTKPLSTPANAIRATSTPASSAAPQHP
jgi:hypothetical protein